MDADELWRHEMNRIGKREKQKLARRGPDQNEGQIPRPNVRPMGLRIDFMIDEKRDYGQQLLHTSPLTSFVDAIHVRSLMGKVLRLLLLAVVVSSPRYIIRISQLTGLCRCPSSGSRILASRSLMMSNGLRCKY